MNAEASGRNAAPASVRRDGDALVFAGTLDRNATARLWPQARPLLAGARRIDLSAVGAVDSAGLALLAEAAEQMPEPEITGAPEGYAELRAAYRLDDRLGFGD